MSGKRIGFSFLIFFCLCSAYAQSSSPLFLYKRGKIKLSDDSVKVLIRKNIEEKPTNYIVCIAYYYQGKFYRKEGKSMEAFRSFANAFRYHQTGDRRDTWLKTWIYNKQGSIMMEYGLHKDAVNWFQRGITPAYKYSKKRNFHIELHIAKATANFDQETAYDMLTKLLWKSQERPQLQSKICNQLGKIHLARGEYKKARDYFEAGLWLKPKRRVRTSIYHNMARLFCKENKLEKEREYLLKALEITPKRQFRLFLELGENYLKEGKNDSAFSILKKAEALYNTQTLKESDVRLFELLSKVSPEKESYMNKYITELENFSIARVKDLQEISRIKNELATLEDERQHRMILADYRHYIAFLIVVIISTAFSLYLRRKTSRKQLEDIISSDLPDFDDPPFKPKK